MGPYRPTPSTNKHAEEGEGGRVRYGVASMQGWRTTMENSHAAIPELDDEISFFGVYDGKGGRSVSKFCAKHLHLEFLKEEANSSDLLSISIGRAFMRMDEIMEDDKGWTEMVELGYMSQKLAGMLEGVLWSRGDKGALSDLCGRTCGTSACIAIIKDKKLTVGNAGDSRCVLSKNGLAFQMSRDHTLDIDTESERVKEAGGIIDCSGLVNGRLKLTRSIGHMDLKDNLLLSPAKQIIIAEPELETATLSEDFEFIVLATHGVWECMSSQEVVDFVHDHINDEVCLSAVCEKLLDQCLAPEAGGTGCDNMTVILVDLKNRKKSDVCSSATISKQSAAARNETRPKDSECMSKCEDPVHLVFVLEESPSRFGTSEEKSKEPNLDELLLSVLCGICDSYWIVSCKNSFDDVSLSTSLNVISDLTSLFEIIEKLPFEETGDWKAAVGLCMNKVLKEVYLHIRSLRDDVSYHAQTCSVPAPTLTEGRINGLLASIRSLLDLATVISQLITVLGHCPLKAGKVLSSPICGFKI